MTGQIALTIRFILYPVAGWLVGNGIMGEGNSEAFVSSMSEVIAGIVVYAGTVIWSRIAASKGGAT